MTTGLLSAELSATCNALGYNDGAKYYTDPFVRETVKDLIRYLRRDDEDHQIRRHLGNAKVLQTDLIPIMIHHSGKEDLFDVVLRLVVNLTNPALLVYHEEIPVDKTARNHYLQIISHLQSYKEAFIEQRVWDVLARKLGELLQIEYHERDEDVGRTMERILILARNVLNVPVDPDLEKRPDNDASVHDQVLWALHQAGMVDMFLYIASTENEQQFYLHILEIVTLMLREQKPGVLASSAVQRSVEEKEKDETELLALRQAEITQKQQKIRKYAGSRHSRFGGTFVLKNMKSISDNDVIYHKTLDKVSNLTFDSEKKKVKTPKNLLAMQYQSGERKSAFSIRLFLKEFCVEFMNGAYNSLMRRVKENLVRATGQPNDESYYFWAMKFFMEFNRKYKFEVKLISETMSRQTFHFVQTQLETWHEMMVTDKKKIPLWSKRMHLAVKAYQELLYTLMAMDMSSDSTVRESSRVIKSNVFYVPEYRELIIMLFNLYSELKFSKEYLKDLVQTAHIFLKMLEHYSSRHRSLMVQTKKKSRTKKKKPAKKSAVAANLEAIWEQVGPQLSVVLQSQDAIPTDIVPFDAASDLDMDQQKVEAMKKIQMELKQGNFEEAVGLLRAAREVWPENNCFGNSTMQADEEFLAMREIFLADIGQPVDPGATNRQTESEDDEENEEDEQALNMAANEQNFNFFDFAKRFASAKVVAALCQLLAQFDKNSDEINHCIAKILHRIVWDCKCPAMLFQATVFRTFQRLMKSRNPAHKELSRLGKYVVRKFYEVSLINRKVFVEMLFWKTSKDAYEIEFGYGVEKTHSSKNVWTEVQEDELRRLFIEYERDEPEPDCVEWIMKNLIKQDRSKRSVVKKLKEMYLYVGNKNKSKSSRPPKEFTEEEEEELGTLFNEYKDALDPMACIMGKLTIHRPKNKIIEKLLAMGLVEDRKQLFKKRQKKIRHSGDNSDSDLDTDRDSDSATTPVQKNKTLSRRRQVSSGQIAAMLRKVLDSDLKEALIWVHSCVKDVLEDLDNGEENEEGTALLPLSETSMCAMDNPIFLQFLDIIDIHRPTDQEVYWRIPGHWKAGELTYRMAVIDDALEGRLPSTLEVGDNEADQSSQDKKKIPSFDGEKNSKDADSQAHAAERRVGRLNESRSVDSDGRNKIVQKSKSKRVVLDSSSDEEEYNSVTVNSFSSVIVQQRSIKSNSGEDSDSTNHSDKLNGDGVKQQRRFVYSSSEDEGDKMSSRNVRNSSGNENNSTVANAEQIELNTSSYKKNAKSRKSFESSSDEGHKSTMQINGSFKNNGLRDNKTKHRRMRVESSSEDEDLGKKTSLSLRNEDSAKTSSDEEVYTSTQKSSIDDKSDSKIEDTTVTSSVGEKKRKRVVVESSSDEEDVVHKSTQESTLGANNSKPVLSESLSTGMSEDYNVVEKKRKRLIVDSSSDDDSSQKPVENKKSRIVSYDSD